MNDSEAMRLALILAHSVEGRTSPRPSVGAVVIRDGIVVGQGATSPPYGPHAEAHALNQAGSAARGADLYTTLEPCCIAVHTPPCTQAIIKAEIRRVVIGALDPNPRVYEQGVAQLRAEGIEVITGIEEQEASEIVQPFTTYITRKRPYVTAKWAMTLDGKIATHTGDAFWISGPAARVWVHNLRDRVDAILIGSGTAQADNPQLTVRLTAEQRAWWRIPRQGPLRVILATNGALANDLALLQPDSAQRTCVIVGESCPKERSQYLQERGVEVIQVANTPLGQIDLQAAWAALAEKDIMHVLLEGGARLLGTAFDQSLIDHVAVFIAPKLVGGKSAPSSLKGMGIAAMRDAIQLQNQRHQVIDGDLLVEGDILNAC